MKTASTYLNRQIETLLTNATVAHREQRQDDRDQALVEALELIDAVDELEDDDEESILDYAQPRYRELVKGEDIIQPGDEVWSCNIGPWIPVRAADHGAQYRHGYFIMRRPVTSEPQPRYRELVKGEDIIQPGDEVWSFGKGPWEPVSPSEYGAQYRHGYFIMRRPGTSEPQYRDLVPGEKLAPFDQWMLPNGEWSALPSYYVGVTYKDGLVKARRPISFDTIPAMPQSPRV